MKLDPNIYPLSLLQNFDSLRWQLRQIAKDNSHLIIEKKEKDKFLFFTMKNKIIDSLFTVKSAKLETRVTTYLIEKKPCSKTNNSQTSFQSLDAGVITAFKDWLNILQGYMDFDYEDEIEQEYETEFYDNWKFLDDDADLKPFKLHEQISILTFLNAANSIIESEAKTEIIEDIVSDINNVHENITKYSKNEVIQKISKIVAKTFKHSRKLGGELLVELKKYVFKQVIINGHQYIQTLIEGFTTNPLSE